MRPDAAPAPLAVAAARRHQLTRARAIQALRELDRAGTPVTFAGVAQAAGISRSWLYTQPDISGQIRRPREKTHDAGSAGAIRLLPGSGLPMRHCAPGSPLPSTAISSSPTRTPGSAASSPARSATSAPPGPDQVTIQTAETPAIRPQASRRRHCPRRDAAGHNPG